MIKRLNEEEFNGNKGYTYMYETKISNRFEALKYVIEEKTPNELWEETKKVLITTSEEIVGYKKKDRTKPWITEETLNLIDKKREAKQRDKNEYREMKAKVQRELRKDKQKHLESICRKAELENQMENSRYIYKTIKTITRKFQPKLHCIQAENGEYITKPEDIAERWKEDCEELYNGAERE